MNQKTALFGGALLAGGIALQDANADVQFTGAITTTASSTLIDSEANPIFGSARYSDVTIDLHAFSVNSDGAVAFDVLSYREFNSWGDMNIRIWHDDGDLSFDDFIIANDDDNFGNDINGSGEHVQDSFLTTNLTAGSYLISISTFFHDRDETLAGVNSTGTFLRGDWLNFDLPDSAEYQIDIYGDVIVPAPGGLPLLALLGCVGLRRLRN